MKKTLFLLLAIATVALSAKLAGVADRKVQSRAQQGSITGRVYAVEQEKDEQGKDQSSILFVIGNLCQKEPCEKQPIDKVTLTFDDKRLSSSVSETDGLKAQGLDEETKKFLKETWQQMLPPGNQLALAPTQTGVVKIDASTFGTSWAGDWKVEVEKTKNKTAVTSTDKDAEKPDYSYYGRVDLKLGIDYLPKNKFGLTAEYKGKTVYDEEIKPDILTRSMMKWQRESGMSFANILTPGKPAYGTINRDTFSAIYNWSYGNASLNVLRPPLIYAVLLINNDPSVPARIIPADQFLFPPELALQELLWRMNVPLLAKTNDSIRIIAADTFGQVFFSTKLGETVIDNSDGISSCQPGIKETTKYVFEGRVLCVCGCFSLEDAEDIKELLKVFTLDGKQINPISFSPTTAAFFIPSPYEPGLHKLGYADADGKIAQSLDFRVLRLAGKVDQKELLRGNSTPMTLEILGTEEVLPLRYENTTTNIISILEGDKKTVMTSGKKPNQYKGTVKGIQVGNFNISYALDGPPCPCFPPETAR